MPTIKQIVKISHVAPIKKYIKMWKSIHSILLHESHSTILDPAKTPHQSSSRNDQSLCNVIDAVDEFKLDDEQRRAVLEAKNIILNKEERILSIDGLPGKIEKLY